MPQDYARMQEEVREFEDSIKKLEERLSGDNLSSSERKSVEKKIAELEICVNLSQASATGIW